MPDLFNLTDAAQAKLFRGLFYLWGIAFAVMFVKISGGLTMLLPPVSPDVWAMSSPEHLIYLSLMKYFLLFELASRTALLYVGGLVAFAFVRRRRNAPRWIMMFLVAYLGVLIVEEIMPYIMIKQKYEWFIQAGLMHVFPTKELLFVFANCFVWLPLFARSAQMKGLFTHDESQILIATRPG